ncbi:hypothetical protein [Aquimarina sp. 2201CG14-23]|uniref:hypothetical protein n=1 Tax=Aquimarina mycalae TaxID=3040073 RepID=UPI002477F056|nr:hypothetical protein [Aquimarina sp. 2201CG14-23]MDH7444941.1 hypothetical protein [Aquimarina sp. 2201CG14-23]
MKIRIELLIILFLLINIKFYSQNFFTEGNTEYGNLGEILTKSIIIEENKEDTIYIKLSYISSPLQYATESKFKINKNIIFKKEEELYNELIDNYYDFFYLDIDYNIARVGYMQRSKSKVIELIFHRNNIGQWSLIKKSASGMKLKNNDFLWKLIKQKLSEKKQ